MVAEIENKTSKRIQYDVNYTWSHALDYNQNETTTTLSSGWFDPYNIDGYKKGGNYGNSQFNVPNRLVAWAIINSPEFHGRVWSSMLANDWSLNPVFQGQNGLPYSATIGTGYPSYSAYGSSWNGAGQQLLDSRHWAQHLSQPPPMSSICAWKSSSRSNPRQAIPLAGDGRILQSGQSSQRHRCEHDRVRPVVQLESDQPLHRARHHIDNLRRSERAGADRMRQHDLPATDRNHLQFARRLWRRNQRQQQLCIQRSPGHDHPSAGILAAKTATRLRAAAAAAALLFCGQETPLRPSGECVWTRYTRFTPSKRFSFQAFIAERRPLTHSSRRLLYGTWLSLIIAFAMLHALNLRADFPNHSPWFIDWAKYTDEGWYGNAAIRAHLFGNWYLPGDFNPAPAVPVWPFLEWVLFFFTGVTIQAARGLAVTFFFANLLLSYLLLRARGPRWMALLAVTLLVTSPFLYCFSRLAILEPMLTALTLAALNLAVRLPRFRRPVLGFGLDRPAFHADDAHQDHRAFSHAGPGLGHRAAALEETQAGRALRSRPAPRRRICRHLWPVDGAGRRLRPLARLQVPLLCEHIRQARGVLLAAAQPLVVVSRRAVGGPYSDSAGRHGGVGRAVAGRLARRAHGAASCCSTRSLARPSWPSPDTSSS